MKPLLKICGLMRPEDVKMCCRLGVDICGFVTEYPLAVPWNLTKEKCAGLLACMTDYSAYKPSSADIPPSETHASSPAKSCIVTGGKREKILQLALSLRPDYVQLHFQETFQDVEFLLKELSPSGIQVIKTIPLSEKERLEQFGVEEPKECARMLSDAGVSIILVDSRGPSNAAVGGTATNITLYEKIRVNSMCPVMIGGGITAKSCREIKEKVQPDIIDVMTGVEISPGVKSKEQILELIRVIRT